MSRHLFRSSVMPWASLALVLLAWSFSGRPAAADETPKPKVVDLAICLDTSSSMDGLIDSAKQKLWDIVNDLARAKPTPDVRVALYSYGNNAYDPKTGWVRLEIGLTTDLDKVSEKLFALKATKVPNSEEYVGRVCRDAIERLDWSKDAAALRVIFVCGNESAEQDPEVKLKPLAETAAKRDIVINTIYCGHAADADAAGWKEFARLAEGRFAAIDQDRGVVNIAAPQDKELADLSTKLNSTFCFYGKNAKTLAENQRAQDDNVLRLGAGAAASRAESKGGGLYRFEGQDLVERLRQDPKFDVKKVAAEELTDELKKMTPEEREKHVRNLLAKREELEKQIGELAKKREAYIQAELKKNPNAADRAFDEAVRGALRDQGKKKGLDIPK
jgi:von Willebrand factor type A domain